MPTIERTITTTASPEAVWAYLSDFTTTNEWDPGTVRTVRRTGNGEVGTEYHNTSKFLGRETQLVYTVVESSAPTRIQLRGENESVTATDTITMTPQGSGTRVHYVAQLEFRGMLRRLDPLFSLPVLNLPFKRLGDGAQQGIQRNLDRL
ncbi:MAG: polyketide cyclase [Nocardioidaceae bacterium]|jgi:carbon monoxide dehydrogenase subunit G|nr:polyketide cyclase [Nocardioidaceae bacterium]